MLIDLAKIHKFGLANSLLDSPMATWLTLTGTLLLILYCLQSTRLSETDETNMLLCDQRCPVLCYVQLQCGNVGSFVRELSFHFCSFRIITSA